MDGVLVIDKPLGPTSHDVVARVRRALREPRVGHTGTLDPNATGVLPLVVGKATRLARFLSARDKQYEATIRLGLSTDTGDAAGRPLGPEYDGVLPPLEAIDAALESFRGQFLQQPPAFSAKKIDGQRSYRLARAASRIGVPAGPDAEEPGAAALSAAVPRPQPVLMTVHTLTVRTLEAGSLRLYVHCSAGFYVRSLAHDLGEQLGTGAHLTALRRVYSGEFGIDDAVPLAAVEDDPGAAADRLVPLGRLLRDLPGVVLTVEGLRHVRHGRSLSPADISSRQPGSATGHVQRHDDSNVPGTWIRLLGPDNDLVGLGTRRGDSASLHPSVVLI
jgi:tRNA pseudouridine55 synthase